MYARVIRDCGQPHMNEPHTWEYINLRTQKRFRRGRVVFFCPHGVTYTTIERMRMLRS